MSYTVTINIRMGADSYVEYQNSRLTFQRGDHSRNICWYCRDKTTAQSNGDQKYEAGVYTKELTIGDSVVNLQLSLDEDRVKAVEFVNLSESVETMYPLMQPTVEKLSRQLAAGKTMEEIVVSEDTQYTEKILVETVSEMLKEHTKN